MKVAPLVKEALLALSVVALISALLLTINFTVWRPTIGVSTTVKGSILRAYGVRSISVYCREDCVIAYYPINGSAWKHPPKEYVVSAGEALTLRVSNGVKELVVSAVKCRGINYPSPNTCSITLNPDIRYRVAATLLLAAALALTSALIHYLSRSCSARRAN